LILTTEFAVAEKGSLKTKFPTINSVLTLVEGNMEMNQFSIKTVSFQKSKATFI